MRPYTEQVTLLATVGHTEVEIVYQQTTYPGRDNGPPEDCYESECEDDLESAPVWVDGVVMREADLPPALAQVVALMVEDPSSYEVDRGRVAG